jgi:hypothetical protein
LFEEAEYHAARNGATCAPLVDQARQAREALRDRIMDLCRLLAEEE